MVTQKTVRGLRRRLRVSQSESLKKDYVPTSGLIPSFLSLSLSDISYKEIVLNYIKTHDVPYHLKEYIEDELQKCISDSEVYELIIRINHRLNIVNCFEMGFRVHVPIRFEDEIASYDSLTVLNKKTPHPVITTEWGLFQKLKT